MRNSPHDRQTAGGGTSDLSWLETIREKAVSAAVEPQPEKIGSPGDNRIDLGQMIRSAFSLPNDWRTIGGIARATGLSYDVIRSFIAEHPLIFERSPIQVCGRTLYALKTSRSD